MRDEVGDPVAGAAVVVGQHHVRVDPSGRAVDEHGRHTRPDLRLQVAVVVPGRDHHQTVHPARAQGQRQLLLALGVLGAGTVDQQGAVRAGHLLDGAAERAVERVREILQHQADARRPALAQHPGAVVAAEAERLDRLLHPALGVRGDPGLAVDHPGDRLQSDPGARRHVLHRRPVAVPVRGKAVCAAGGLGHDASVLSLVRLVHGGWCAVRGLV